MSTATAIAETPEQRAARVTRVLGRVGGWGAALTLAILAASVALRLSTSFDPAGEPVSTLPEVLETVARLGHRLSAMVVSVLAVLAAMIVFSTRPWPAGRVVAMVLILADIGLLAALGRHTPGYRVAAVTLANVLGGMVLACAFWWLREDALPRTFRGPPRAAAYAWLALAALVAQSALGAVTSALAMRGDRVLDPLHLAMGVAFVAFAALAAWPHLGDPRSRVAARIVASLAAMQFLLGLALAQAGATRPAPAGWLHAMIACALALALVSLAMRSRK
ncbi:hypothetical protein [Usitatibacter palustris]|uniref:Cytochrome c oxidase assembly protein subunit 15 n=1 Tax=Usitatibacter palustris TaxID=2732487 RepID=A0A6M4H3S8_9PROT|nr:hypothetical protein [Usitatibacter palustris]QJR14251.1 hypothetical protein DSM104440_01044 [Usitatibacter palustris]